MQEKPTKKLSIGEKISQVLDYYGVSKYRFSQETGVSEVVLHNITKGKNNPSFEFIQKILNKYDAVNADWLINGIGEMLKSEQVQFYSPENAPQNKRLIPLFDDVQTIGGSDTVALTEANRAPAEWIDPGDWFKAATHAIRHYGESMAEYPKGCILAIKEVKDRRLIIPGKDYVIETAEYRVTKKIQFGNDSKYIVAHSTNSERYDDGSLVHQPFNIYWDLIDNIYEVLGYVVKKGSGTIVLSNQ